MEKNKFEIKLWHILIVGVILFLCGMIVSYFIFSNGEIDGVEDYNVEKNTTQNEEINFNQIDLNINEINNNLTIDENSNDNNALLVQWGQR